MLVLCKAGIFSFFSCVCGPKFSSKTMASEALSISLPKVGGEILQMTSAVPSHMGPPSQNFINVLLMKNKFYLFLVFQKKNIFHGNNL